MGRCVLDEREGVRVAAGVGVCFAECAADEAERGEVVDVVVDEAAEPFEGGVAVVEGCGGACFEFHEASVLLSALGYAVSVHLAERFESERDRAEIVLPRGERVARV